LLSGVAAAVSGVRAVAAGSKGGRSPGTVGSVMNACD
jgi:hypothetical protein